MKTSFLYCFCHTQKDPKGGFIARDVMETSRKKEGIRFYFDNFPQLINTVLALTHFVEDSERKVVSKTSSALSSLLLSRDCLSEKSQPGSKIEFLPITPLATSREIRCTEKVLTDQETDCKREREGTARNSPRDFFLPCLSQLAR